VRGSLKVRLVRLLGVTGLGLMGFAATHAAPAPAYMAGPPSPELLCSLAASGDLITLENTLSPANAATVTMGTPVSFSGVSRTPLTFAVASGTPLLQPDIDTGAGSVMGESSRFGGLIYVFTSTNASAVPRTIYWTASFSDASIPACAGLLPATYTTPVRTLTVLPPPTETTHVQEPAPAPTPMPPLLKGTIGELGSFRVTHPSISFRIQCTTSCSGETSSRAYLVRAHAKPLSAPELDLAPSYVSIASASGGTEQFTHGYSGRSLRLLKRVLHGGGAVELRLTAKLSGSSGNGVLAQQTIWLR
jgi:hypothetical protein